MTALDLDAARALRSDVPHYDRIQRFLHWGMAAIIIVAMLIGLYCSYQVPGTPVRRFLLEWHKSLGLTGLALVALRIVYRLAVPAPPYAERIGWLNHAAASAGHLALYGLMLLLPMSGYALSALGGNSLPFFWLFQWPRVLPVDKAAVHIPETIHYLGAWAIYLVVGLHLAAVAWHQFIKRDSVLRRMLPRVR